MFASIRGENQCPDGLGSPHRVGDCRADRPGTQGHGREGVQALKGEGGTVLKTSLDHTKEAALLRWRSRFRTCS
jgi:hypothetical protein